jgi:hypothetical protein
MKPPVPSKLTLSLSFEHEATKSGRSKRTCAPDKYQSGNIQMALYMTATREIFEMPDL